MKKFILSLILSLCLFGAFAEYKLTGTITSKQNAQGGIIIALFTDSENNNDKVYQTLLFCRKEEFVIKQTKDLKEAIIALNECWEPFSMDDCREYTLQRLRKAAELVEYCDEDGFIIYYIK